VKLRRLLANNTFMLAAAFVVAVLFGGFPEVLGVKNSNISLLSLGIMMSLSLISLQFRGLDVRAHRGAMFRAFVLSFVVSSGVTIALAHLFQGDLRDGWIMVAAVPSAVSVIPFTYMLRGRLEATLVSSAALYMVALLLTPLITLLFLGQAVSPTTVLWYVAVLILLPTVISRFLRPLNMKDETRHIIINIAFAALVITVVGTNRGVFLGEPLVLISLLIVALARTFGVGIAYDVVARRCGVAREQRVPELLFATYKNTGMAAAMSMVLLGPAAAVPAAVLMSAEIPWLIYITRSMAPPAR
jgi:BASS family bile acid:Na+ symporter